MREGKPIGDLAAYAISRAIRIVSPNRNRALAHCRVCGWELTAGEGREVSVEGKVVGKRGLAYLCYGCFGRVRAAAEAFPVWRETPGWWAELDRVMMHGKVLSRSPEEFERVLREREAEVGR